MDLENTTRRLRRREDGVDARNYTSGVICDVVLLISGREITVFTSSTGRGSFFPFFAVSNVSVLNFIIFMCRCDSAYLL